jgi:hypothetical protein
MRKRVTITSILSILAAGGAHSQEPATGAKVRLEVVLTFKNGSYQVEEMLKSDDSRAFVLRRSQLPWGEGRSLYLDTFIPDSRGVKLGSTPLGPPAHDKVSLEAGGSLSGELNLNKRFVGLEKILALHPVIIHWAYQFQAAEPAVAGEWQAGSFVIPRGGLPEGGALH